MEDSSDEGPQPAGYKKRPAAPAGDDSDDDGPMPAPAAVAVKKRKLY